MGKLDGKVAIVTGGTSGIGEATARLFATEGASVVITGRNIKNGVTIARSIPSSFFVPCDITHESEIEYFIENFIDLHGKIDILFNNAGSFTSQVMLTNFIAMDRMCIECLPYMPSLGGVILNNASIAGLHSYNVGHSYAYSASKAAIIKMTQMMAKNYAKDGIRVNCISPGIIDTPMFKGADMSGYLDRIPVGRIGSVEDVAKAALFLCSDDSSYITGHNLIVDGGVSV